MNGTWRGALAALLGHALLAPGVESVARGAAVLALLALLLRSPRRGFVLVLALVGGVGGLRLQAEVRDAVAWSGWTGPVRVEVLECRDWGIRGRIGAPGRPVSRAWITGLDEARVGDRWVVGLEVRPLVVRRNPDDRDGLRRGLASGALLRAKASGDAGRTAREGPGPVARLRATITRAWEERLGDGGAFWSALLLADRRGLAPAAQERVREQGLAHLLALSGLHVGVMTAVLSWPWRHAGPAARAGVIPVLLAWTALAGAGPSMVRAVGLVIWIAGAHARGTGGRALDGLAALAVLESALRPEELCGVGWWLSYAATTAILRVLPLLRGRPWWWTGLALSCAAQLGTATWTLDTFGRIPLLAPLLLLLLGPVFGMVLSVGGVAACLALLPGAVGSIAAAGAAMLAHGFGALVARAEGSGAWAFTHPGLTGGAYVVALVVSALFLVPGTCGGRWPGRTVVGVVVGLLVGLHLTLWRNPEHRWISLDVGQGDAGVYRCGTDWWIVDTGPGGWGRSAAARVVLPYLRRRGARDATLVLTHAHADHTGGAGELLSSGRIAELALARADSGRDWTSELAARAEAEGVGVRWLELGDTLRTGCCDVVCLWPPPRTRFADANDRSLVLRLGPPRHPLLATGDLERRAERALLARLPPRGDAGAGAGAVEWTLKVGHHGGDTGTDPPWLERLRPGLALVSCGEGNRYGHPDPAVLERLRRIGAVVARTDRDGALELRWPRVEGGPRLIAHGRRVGRPAPVDAVGAATYAADPARPANP